MGRGRSKWKGADGNVVGQDEASGGLALAQQWELLCPGVTRITSGQGAPAGTPQSPQTPVVQSQMEAPSQQMAAAPQPQSAPMGDGMASAFSATDNAPASAQAGPVGQGQMPAATPAAAPCSAPRCFNAGAFTATVTQLLEGQVGPKRDPAVRIGITFRNTGTQPMVLAYAAGTSALVDSVGSHFTIGPPNTPDTSAQGIGKVEGKNADTRFVLQPGEARDAMFQLLKDKPGRATAAGTTRYNYSVGIAQLDGTGAQVRLVRAYRLGFQGLPPGVDANRPAGATSSASLSDAVKDLESAAKKFGDLFDSKKWPRGRANRRFEDDSIPDARWRSRRVLPVYRIETWTRVFLLGAVGAFLQATTASAQTLSAGAPADNFNLSTFASGLNQITDFRFLPDGRVVITRKTGEVMVRTTDGTVVQAGSFPVDTESEKGLLGVELHPQFGQGSNRTLFFYYSRADGSGGTDDNRHRVVSMTLADTNQLSGAETVLIQNLRGPANHDGGGLAIGPDGKLYVGVGDSGCNSGVPPGGSITNYIATCLTTANGKILRINLDGSIPSDNPLVGTSVRACDGTSCTGAQPDPSLLTGVPRTEIWSWGFRNPFRFTFDPQTGSLWVGDVGEVTYEEVNLVTKGQHYGWPYREGAFGYPATTCATLGPNGSGSNCVEPKYFCQHGSSPPAGIDGDCQSITGGVFLDSATWPAAFRGRYFFGDNANGRVWTLTPSANRDGFVSGSRTPFGTGFGTPVRFIVGPDGDLYVANESANTITVIRPKGASDGGLPDGGAPDAGAPDGGAPDSGSSVSGGCGCTSTGEATSAVAMLVLALLAVVGRGRRGAPGRH